MRGVGGANPYAAGANIHGGSINTARGGSIHYGSASVGAVGGNHYGYGGAGRYGYGGAYGGYHNNWVHGYWGGHYGGWGWGGYGAGLFTGLAMWGLGSSLYSGWGYGSYYNPYYSSAAGFTQSAAYNYSQPIDTSATLPDSTVVAPALSDFDQARTAFSQGQYDQALSLTDLSLKTVANDPAIHQFRAVILFALKRYDEAAATLYGVLSTGPGWDWTTFISLYPNVEVYTSQLRDLEAYVSAHGDSSSGHFVLGYLYLTAGQNDAAADQLKSVVKLQPRDQVSSILLKSISKTQTPATIPVPDPGVAVPTGGILEGTWTAAPSKDTTITLAVTSDGKFTWTVTPKGQQAKQLEGHSTYSSNVLTLVQGQGGPPMVGEVTKTDNDHFTFQAAGGGTADPGLAFSRVK